MRHTFLVVTVKKWFKSVYIYPFGCSTAKPYVLRSTIGFLCNSWASCYRCYCPYNIYVLCSAISDFNQLQLFV